MLSRFAVLIFGIIAYLIGASAYFFGLGGFLANALGPYSVDQGVEASVPVALAINSGLIILFGLPHSLMARRRFKQWWTKFVPKPIERSMYMLQAGLLALLLIWQWRAIPITIWEVESQLLSGLIWGLYFLGWVIAFIATFLINHFELTGLQQVFAYARGKAPVVPRFRTPFLYRIVRHPMQLGALIAFWAAPHMTVGRLVFAVGMTTYILIGLTFEERDMVRRFGDTYCEYQRTTPRLIPAIFPRSSTRRPTQSAQRTG